MLLYELLQSELVTQKHFSVFGGRGGVQEGVMVLRGERERAGLQESGWGRGRNE